MGDWELQTKIIIEQWESVFVGETHIVDYCTIEIQYVFDTQWEMGNGKWEWGLQQRF